MPHPLLSKGAYFLYPKVVIPTEVEGPLFDFEAWAGDHNIHDGMRVGCSTRSYVVDIVVSAE